MGAVAPHIFQDFRGWWDHESQLRMWGPVVTYGTRILENGSCCDLMQDEELEL